MKRPYPIIASILVLCLSSCDKQGAGPSPQPERELSIPEKVEKEITDVLSKDWKSLSDTLAYFDSTMLSKGKTKGIAPDGIYYELSAAPKGDSGFVSEIIGGNYKLQNMLLNGEGCNYGASAVCTIPEPAIIDSLYFERAFNDTSFVAKMHFHNAPGAGKLYQTFRRVGPKSEAYEAVDFTTPEGALQDTVITEMFMKPLKKLGTPDVYFLHPGDTLAIKLAAIERPIYEFWSSYANYANSSGTVLSAPTNVKGNVSGAIGYWAGYGIDVKEIICKL